MLWNGKSDEQLCLDMKRFEPGAPPRPGGTPGGTPPRSSSMPGGWRRKRRPRSSLALRYPRSWDTAWYRYVAKVWRHADPELQPHVAEAREALERLTRE